MISEADIQTALLDINRDTAARRRVRSEVNYAIHKTITEITVSYTDTLREVIRNGGSVVSGEMVSSIRQHNTHSSIHYLRSVGVSYSPMVRIVSSGTVQGMPPVEPTGTTMGSYGLREWVERKGITSEKYKTPKQLAWAIAKSIQKKGGVPGKFYRESALGIWAGDDVYMAVQMEVHRKLEDLLGPDYMYLIANFATFRQDPFTLGEDW